MSFKIGRPKKQISNDYLKSIYNDYASMTGREVAEKYKISQSTVMRYIRLYKNTKEVKEHHG